MKVAVLGASNDPERYSHKALLRLREAGHQVFPIHPKLTEIEGLKVVPSLDRLPERVDTVTVYVSAEVSSKIAPQILSCGARRIIFNPGAENPALEEQALQAGLHVVRACTLVLLSTGQFEKA